MHIYEDFWELNQRTHTLLADWCHLCATGLSMRNLRAFHETVLAQRAAMAQLRDRLLQELTYAAGICNPGAYDEEELPPRSYAELLGVFTFIAPYLEAYPAMDFDHFWRCFAENTHDYYYPLPPPDVPYCPFLCAGKPRPSPLSIGTARQRRQPDLYRSPSLSTRCEEHGKGWLACQ